MNSDDDNALVERAIKAAEPFKVAHIAMDVLNLKRLLSTELHEEARHDLRLIASIGQQWQPIDTAPKEGPAILIWCPYYRSGYTVKWNGDSSNGYWFHWCDVNLHRLERAPTHWMPLPAAPGKEE